MRQSTEYTRSERPALELFQRMGYQHLQGKDLSQRKDITEVILFDRLEAALQRINPWMNSGNLQKALTAITAVNGTSLLEINQKIWQLLRGGQFDVQQVIDGKKAFHPVHFIDYQTASNNDFLVVNQMRFHGKAQHSIPDIVVYINGLPLAVIECKAPSAKGAWDSAYGDLKAYQRNSERLFYYNQLCVGLWRQGGRYGAIGAPQPYYSVYRPAKDEDLSFLGEQPPEQSILLYALFRPERLLDIIRHFVIYETSEGVTVKKLPRYQQLRATNKTIARLQADTGGVVWHTQGSGKSITMAYVTRKLQAPEYGFDNPTVMVLTDRRDLDGQITKTFRNIGFKNVFQASSVAHLDQLLRNDYGSIITTTLQKFQEPNEANTAPNTSPDATEHDEEENEQVRIEKQLDGNQLTKITKELQSGKWVEVSRETVDLEELSSKKNLYILVDEAHRSHYGFLAAFMRTVLPHAKFVAFTGTPISKEDKSTLGEFYGGDYIDVYTIKESVADGATVELLYDEGIAKIDIKKEELDKEFEENFGHLSAEKKDKLKREALRKYQLSAERVREICKHLLNHFSSKIHPDGHKAMIVCSGRPAAIKYQQTLQALREAGEHNFSSKVVVSIGSPKTDAIAQEYYEAIKWNKEHPNKPQKPTWVVPPELVKTVTDDFKLPYGDESELDKSGQRKKYDNTALLIVSDMLLTGYDVPIASCLYLDKPLKEHNLLQAIARVNRSGNRKKAGYIVDYNGITANLLEALEIFSGDLRPDDILKNLAEEIPVLVMNHTKLVDFFKPLRLDRVYETDKYIDAAVRYIEPLDRRDSFKMLLKDFNKSINIVLPDPQAMAYQSDFKLFNQIKLTAKNTYEEDEELKISADESLLLQAMIDEHLKSTGVHNLLEEPVSIFDREKFQEELDKVSPATKELKMRNKLKYSIKVGLDKNPDFYKPLAQRLEDLLKEREAKRIDEAQLMLAYANIQDAMIEEQKEGANKGFHTEQERAVYQTMKTLFPDDAENATRSIFKQIAGELEIVGWEDKDRVQKDLEVKISRYLKLGNIGRTIAKNKAKELVNILKKNKGE